MQALSFVIAFGFLGAVSVLGALMVVMSSRRLLGLVGNPALSLQHLGVEKVGARVAISATVLTLGFILLAIGIRGIYRVVWVPF